MTLTEFVEENTRLRHAIQTGVEYERQFNDGPTSGKHLRTGLDAQMSEFASLVQLLVAKGVFSEQEYFDASLQALRDEVARYERRLSDRYGIAITLA